MNRTILILILLGVVAGLSYLWLKTPEHRAGPQQLTDVEIARAWLECIDCQGTFLRRISEMRGKSQDTVTQIFRNGLLSGLDASRKLRREQGLRRSWLADSAYRRTRGLPIPDQDSIVQAYLRGFEVMWRSRAAVGLGVIRGNAALAALNSSLNLSLQDPGDRIILGAVEEAKADSARKVLDLFAPGGTGSAGGTGGGGGTGTGGGTGSVSGRVVDDGGTALANANVEVVELSFNALTGNNGEYTFVHVPPGTYSIRVRMHGYQPRTASITVVAGQTTNHNVTLPH
jgi:Carboxypeptidase regulatory-like domain